MRCILVQYVPKKRGKVIIIHSINQDIMLEISQMCFDEKGDTICLVGLLLYVVRIYGKLCVFCPRILPAPNSLHHLLFLLSPPACVTLLVQGRSEGCYFSQFFFQFVSGPLLLLLLLFLLLLPLPSLPLTKENLLFKWQFVQVETVPEYVVLCNPHRKKWKKEEAESTFSGVGGVGWRGREDAL